MASDKKTKRKKKVVRVWTLPQAQRALPYVTAVMRSLREHWLDSQRHRLQDRRLAAKPGRPDRDRILAQQAAAREAGLAKERFNEAYQELQAIEVYCLDPVQGLAALPFVQDDRLAWLLFDLFDADGYKNWRFHDDPLEKRRPIREAEEGPADKGVTV